MPKIKANFYSENMPLHHAPGSVSRNQIVAVRIAVEFGRKQPTVAQLVRRFGMCKATAHRWRAAWEYVEGVQLTPGQSVSP